MRSLGASGSETKPPASPRSFSVGPMAASGSEAEPPAMGFFDMYSEDELASVLRVHEAFFLKADEGTDPETDPCTDELVRPPKQSLRDLVLNTIAEIDVAQNDDDSMR